MTHLRKTNHVLIATGIFPPDIGGPSTILSHLAQDLTERGFEIKIVTYAQKHRKHPLTPFRAGKNNYKIYRINKNFVFSKIAYFIKMLRLARFADILYVTDTYSVGYFAYLVKKLTGKKYILRFTGDSAWETARTNGWTRDYIVDFVTKEYHPDPELAEGEGSREICDKIKKLKKRRNKILFNADKIIVDCEFNKELAIKIGVTKNKIQVIYNSVDFMNIKIEQKIVDEIRKKYQGKVIVTACRLTCWKGVDQIINILPELLKQIGPINFLILGEGKETENLKLKTKNLCLENNVHFLGKINQEEMQNYFKAADVFILNSQYEGLSHTLLEAMQADMPIIASNCGGNPELIENNKDGILVEYNNQEQLLDACVKILSDSLFCHPDPASSDGVNYSRDPEKDKKKSFAEFLSNNAQEKVKKFKWSEVAERTQNVIVSLVRE